MNKKASYGFRTLAGVYLVYLAYSLIKGYILGDNGSAGFMVVGILFGAVGLFFCVTGLRGRKQADQEMQEAQEAYDDSLSQPSDEEDEEKEDQEKLEEKEEEEV